MPQSRFAFLAVLATVILISAWLWWNAGEEAPPGEATPTPQANTAASLEQSQTSESDPLESATAPVTPHQRTEAATGPGSSHATLQVLARWPGDVAAAGVMVALRNAEPGTPYTPFARKLTDDAGVATFDNVPHGDMRLLSDRGDRQKVLVTGSHQEVVFELKGGIAVTGTVVNPDGSTIADAGVWLQTRGTTWADGHVATTTNANGEFTLQHINPEQSLGAVAAGYAPSPLLDLDLVDKSNPPVTIELKLGAVGGRLEGTLRENGEQPIAGVQVTVGSRPGHLETRGERIVEQWSTRTATTNERGFFAIDGLKPGERKVAMRHPDFGIDRTTVEIKPGITTYLHHPLQAAGTLHGRVTDSDGNPIPKARVRLYDQAPRTSFIAGGQIDFDEAFGYRSTQTDDNGEYRLESVSSGKVHVFAQRPIVRGRSSGTSVAFVQTELIIKPRENRRWDPVIEDGLVVEGIILYRDGHPISTFVTLADTGRPDQQNQVLVSGSDGVFRFLCLDESTYEVRVQHPFDAPRDQREPIKASGIAPNSGRVELRTPYDKPVKQAPGIVVGRIEDVGNRIRNQNAATVLLHSDEGWFRRGIELTEGAFRIERVTPCRFRVALMEGESTLAQSDWFELEPAATADIGTLTTEPGGSARFRINRSAGAEQFEPALSLRREGDVSSTMLGLGDKAEVIADNLTPGRYRARSWAKGMVSLHSEPFDVMMGQTVDVELTIRAGAPMNCQVWWPPGPAKSTTRKYRILDANGKVLREYEGPLSTSPTHPHQLRSTLPPGRWRIEFSTDDGLTGEVEFEFTGLTDEVRPRLDLK